MQQASAPADATALGRLGVWSHLDMLPAPEVAKFRPAARGVGLRGPLDPRGRRARSVQLPRLPRGEHAHAAARHRHRQHLCARRDDHARTQKTLAELSAGGSCSARRLALPPRDQGARPCLREAGRDHARLSRAMEKSLYMAVQPKQDAPIVLAALRPRMLALAREKARGAHPYFVPPEHTARAREILGRGRGCAPSRWCCSSATPRRRARSRASTC